MKNLILLVVVFTTFTLLAQKPVTVHQLTIKSENFDFYKTQAEAWKKVIDSNPKNEDAWYNYYKACRYARMTFKGSYPKEDSKNWLKKSPSLVDDNDIFDLIYEAVPNTFTYYLMKSLEPYSKKVADEDRSKYLLKAYALEPSNPELFDEIVLHYEITQDLSKRKKLNKEWFKLNSFASGYLNYAYNVLMSVDEDAIIITGGDVDTYSLWMAQDVFDIHTNVQVINTSLITKKDYRSKIFSKLGIPDLTNPKFIQEEGSTSSNRQIMLEHIIENKPKNRPIYIALTNHKEIYSKFEDDMYMTGLALLYSKESIDEVAYIKNSFYNKFLLDYLTEDFSYSISSETVKNINTNYIPALIKLYSHYVTSNETEEINKIKMYIKSITDKASPGWSDWYNGTFNCKE